jgi:hypothetical protein
MNGGAISGNTADLGGGVYVDTSGTFTMEGGAISGNTADYGGGGVYVGRQNSDNYGTFRITNGTIYGSSEPAGLANTATSEGAALYRDGYYAIAEYGKFIGEVWTPNGTLPTTDDTIIVEDGLLQ